MSSHYGLHGLGHTCATMTVLTLRGKDVSLSETLKSVSSTDRSLKLGYVKLESLVIADHHAAVNICTSLVHTARQATGVGSGGSFC